MSQYSLSNFDSWFTTPDGSDLRMSAITKVGPVSVDDIDDASLPGRFFFMVYLGFSGIAPCFYDTEEEATAHREVIVGVI